MRIRLGALFVSMTLVLGCSMLNRSDPKNAAAVIEGPPTAQPLATGAFKVVTYNVHGEPAPSISQALETSRALRGADWIFLQEIEAHPKEGATRAASIAKRFGMTAVYAPGYGLDDGGSHGVALLSRYPLEDVRVIELPRKFVVVNSARRVAIAATALVGGNKVRLYVVHLDNRLNPKDRRHQLRPVVADSRRYLDMPTLIAGDVNTSPFCWGLHIVPVPCGLQDDRLERYLRRSGFATPVTGSGATSRFLDMRLDAVYTRGFDVDDFGVARKVDVSDYLPLWAQVRVAGR